MANYTGGYAEAVHIGTNVSPLGRISTYELCTLGSVKGPESAVIGRRATDPPVERLGVEAA